MSERIGKMLICDRCGSFVFLNYIGTKEFDGGFTKVVDFEDPPKDWGYGDTLVDADNLLKCTTTKRLCPDCRKEYLDMIERFYEKDTVIKSIRERSTVHEP